METIKNLWLPSGKDWLEENFIVSWTDAQENAVRENWEENEDWVLRCHPDKAFLFLLRQYLFGTEAVTEPRLRKLLPILAKFGGTEQMVAALSLLSIMMLENEGWQPEIEAICMQVRREAVCEDTLAHVMRLFLFAQVAVIQGKRSEADGFYQNLLEVKVGSDNITNGLLGRVFEKMGVYLLREAAHPLFIPWQLAVRRWCKRYAASPLAVRLQHLLCEEKGSGPLPQIHPIVQWHWKQKGLDLPQTCIRPELVYADREVEVVALLLAASRSHSREESEQLGYMTRSYGDPYWIDQAANCKQAKVPLEKVQVEEQRAAYYFTFFESFQGYANQETPLFLPRYRRKKVKQLLAILLLQPQYSMVKEVLFDQLFRDECSNHVENYLHVLIFRLRELLGNHSGMSEDWIYLHDGIVRLNPDRIAGVDVQDYRKIASVGHQLWLDDPAAAFGLYEKACQMYRPVIAPEFEYEEWMADQRSELMQHQKKMLNRLWDEARATKQIDKALHFGETLLTVDKWDLMTVKQLCRDWKSIGQQQKSVDTCKRYADLLREDSESIPAWMEQILEEA